MRLLDQATQTLLLALEDVGVSSTLTLHNAKVAIRKLCNELDGKDVELAAKDAEIAELRAILAAKPPKKK